MKLSKKLLSLLLCAVMVLGAVPFSGIISFAADSCEHTDADNDNICDSCMRELYVDRRLNAAGDAVVSTLAEIPTSYEELTSETSELEAGRWYFLDEDVKAAARIFANGTPDNPSYLILRDDCTIEADEGIGVGNGHELHIYAQSGDSGKIVAKGGVNNAGIGGSYSSDSCGTLVICGGIISATGGSEGAGIGGGPAGNSGNIMILGGTINACGDFRSAGIGAGLNSHGGTVSIYGGKISATGGEDGEGIGGYCFKNGSYHGTLKVYGGDVTASGGEYSAGIGHNVEIYGGKVKAVGSKYGAGIGGGYGGNGVRFLMHDGTVEAFGGQGGAGIGGGRGGSDESFEIHGGTVTATGGSYAAGIGGGGSYDKAGGFQGASGGNVKMYGGNVTAVGGYGGAGVGGGPTGQGRSVTVYGGTLTARGDYGSAGIGGGYSAPGGTFTIYDGTVIADGGNLSAGIGGGFRADGGSFRMIGGNIEAIGKNAPGIGGGDNAQDNGSFTVTAVAEIKSGSAKPGSETTVEQYITSRNSYVNISGFCGHVDPDGDRVCDYCEKELYIDRIWDTYEKSIVDSLKSIPDDAEAITDSSTVLSSGKTYVVDGNVRIRTTLTADGDAVLILKDNCNLRISYTYGDYGIRVEEGSSLSIYAQSDGANAGKLIADGGQYSAGIGSGRDKNCGTVAIYGGNIIATGGDFGAGIGGGEEGIGGNINIYGGNVAATGGISGAGIGGGFFADGGNVNIYGGKITAKGGWFGAGIGGGREGNGGNVTVYAGTVMASSGSNCDIIGHGSYVSFIDEGRFSVGDGTVLYYGADGTVITPQNGSYLKPLNDSKYYDEQGIGTIYFYADTNGTAQNRVSYLEYNSGSGETENKSVSGNRDFPVDSFSDWSLQWFEADGNITIDGPVTVNGNVNLILKDNCTLTVKGRIYVEGDNSLTIYSQSTGEAMGRLIAESGIGSGSKTECGTITIYGGDITAAGNENAAAIGGGFRGGAGTITIYDGNVTATGGANAPGIGNGSMGSGGSVEIYGGTVNATGTEDGIVADNIAVYDAQVTSNGRTLESTHVHHLTKFAAKDAACTEAGNTTTYYACTGDHSCGRFYSDPAGETELTAEQVKGYVIPALSHSFTSGNYSDNNNGMHSEKCIRCSSFGEEEPHELVNGKCTKCSYCEHLSGTYSFEWEYEYTRCMATERCDVCGRIMLIQYSFDISFVEDTIGKDCKTPGKGHYEAVFANLGITGKTDSIFDTKPGPHSYKDYVCVTCGDELLDDAKAAAKAAIDKAADGSSDSTVTTICRTAKSIIDAADSVEKVFKAQEEWLTIIEKQTFEPHEYTFDTNYSKNEYVHWYAATCEHGDLTKGMAAHTFDEGAMKNGEIIYTCTVCGYEKGEDEVKIALAEAQSALAEANKALEEKTAALDTAEEELGKAADELTKAQNALDDKTAALKTAEDNLDAANTALDEAKSQISTLTSELDNANKELSESKAALDEANASLETTKSEKADLEAQLAEKETELDNLIKSSDAKDDEIAALESDIAGLKSDIEAKDGEITEKANEIAGLEKSVSELEKAIETKNGEITDKANEIAALESNVTALEKEISEANSEIAQKNEQIESLNGELEKAKAEIEELKNGEDTSCPYCGKEKHESFFDKVLCFFKRIGNFFRDLFKKIFG